MSDTQTKRLSLHNLKAGMILAKDAITEDGHLLIPAGTELSEQHLFRMNLYQIMSAVIYVTVDNNLIDTRDLENDLAVMNGDNCISQIRLNKTEGFLRFNKALSQMDLLVREQFDLILGGGPVDQEKLLAATNSIIHSVRIKSDLFSYMSHIQSNDQHTYIHSLSVSILCNIFGHWLKMTEKEIDDLTLAGLVHDIGMLTISPELLTKSEQLTEDEFNHIRQHATLGYELLKNKDIPETIKTAVLYHHERNDGSGYPEGRKGRDIPDFAKIIAITDVYNAMTSSRAYHAKFSPFSVIQIFEQESYGYLDTHFLYVFLENIAHYYLGERVVLTDGTVGKIVFIHNQSPSRPIIQAEKNMIDLLTTPEIAIAEIL